jgi:hypothetical protein
MRYCWKLLGGKNSYSVVLHVSVCPGAWLSFASRRCLSTPQRAGDGAQQSTSSSCRLPSQNAAQAASWSNGFYYRAAFFCVFRCLAVICLKTLFEHTPAGRRWSSLKHQQQLQTALSERLSQLDASIHSLPGISHCISIQGAAAAEVELEAERSIRTMAAGIYGCLRYPYICRSYLLSAG